MNTHSIDIGSGRGQHNFDDAMSTIARQAEAQKLLEAKAQRRQALMGTVKKVAGFILGAAILGTAFYYRNEMQGFISAKLNSKPKVDSTTGATLGKVEAAAEKRDQVLNDITK